MPPPVPRMAIMAWPCHRQAHHSVPRQIRYFRGFWQFGKAKFLRTPRPRVLTIMVMIRGAHLTVDTGHVACLASHRWHQTWMDGHISCSSRVYLPPLSSSNLELTHSARRVCCFGTYLGASPPDAFSSHTLSAYLSPLEGKGPHVSFFLSLV